MLKRFSLLLLFAMAATYVTAQDMPPLPPMADQTTVTTTTDNSAASPALPPLPDQGSSSASNSSAPALPPLPDQKGAPAANSAAPALPPLPDQAGASGTSTQASPAMPPLPDQNAASSNASPAMPPLPGEQAQAAPASEGAPATAAPAKKSAHAQHPWERTKKRANVIFAGWVNAKGGNESSRIAWTAQEALNALAFHGFKVVKEEGKYQGQAGADGNQWRQITFSVPKSKTLRVEVFMRQIGKRIWLRVGPGEPPAFAKYSVPEVQKMREANLKALHLIQKTMGKRLSPHRVEKSWEAPYSFGRGTVPE